MFQTGMLGGPRALRTRTFILAVLLSCLPGPRGWAVQAAAPRAGEEPFTVLQIMRYDWSEDLEVVRMSEGLWRIHKLAQDHKIWEDADRLARIQWRQWYRDGSPESHARRWVLPRPEAPQFFTHGRFQDQFEAEEKLKSLKAEMEKRLERYRAYRDQTSLFFLDNLLENRKVVRALIPKARTALENRTDAIVKRWPESRKREIWTVVHQAEQKARAMVADKSAEAGGELDVLDVFNTQQELLKPVYAQFKIDEDQWYLVWEEGDKNKWPLPPSEFLPATYANVLQALQDLRSGKDDFLVKSRRRQALKSPAGSHSVQTYAPRRAGFLRENQHCPWNGRAATR